MSFINCSKTLCVSISLLFILHFTGCFPPNTFNSTHGLSDRDLGKIQLYLATRSPVGTELILEANSAIRQTENNITTQGGTIVEKTKYLKDRIILKEGTPGVIDYNGYDYIIVDFGDGIKLRFSKYSDGLTNYFGLDGGIVKIGEAEYSIQNPNLWYLKTDADIIHRSEIQNETNEKIIEGKRVK